MALSETLHGGKNFIMTKKKTVARKTVPHKQPSALRDIITRKPPLREAAQWPILDCLISDTWRDPMYITQLLLARQSPQGHIVIAAFVVDQACLGVKNAMVLGLANEEEYHLKYLKRLTTHQRLIPCSVDLLVKVVQESMRYAAALGLRPNKDTADALVVVGEAHPEHVTERIPLGGPNGKPFFINGPYDDVPRILKALERSVGQGNFDYNFIFHSDQGVDDNVSNSW